MSGLAPKMANDLNDLAQRVARELTRARPEFAANQHVFDSGDVELHIEAPAQSKARALVVLTARGEDIWIRFAPPQMFYGVDDEKELIEIVDALLTERALFVRIVDAEGKWAGTTLVAQDTDVDLDPGQRATVLSWSGRFDQEFAAELPPSSWIEFHDSELVAVSSVDADVHLDLNAYVHAWSVIGDERHGTGWIQPVRITVVGARDSQIPQVLPLGISDGEIILPAVVHRNSVPLPFTAAETIVLRLRFTTGEESEWTGAAAKVAATGSARYVEDLPSDFWPGVSQ